MNILLINPSAPNVARLSLGFDLKISTIAKKFGYPQLLIWLSNQKEEVFFIYFLLLFLTFWVWGIGFIRGIWYKQR